MGRRVIHVVVEELETAIEAILLIMGLLKVSWTFWRRTDPCLVRNIDPVSKFHLESGTLQQPQTGYLHQLSVSATPEKQGNPKGRNVLEFVSLRAMSGFSLFKTVSFLFISKYQC